MLDVWGYVILRGTAGDATLLPLNAAPVIETQFTRHDGDAPAPGTSTPSWRSIRGCRCPT